jgi:hypothetical protein
MERQLRLPNFSGPERRGSVRLPLALEVHCVSHRLGKVETGEGKTIDISSSGLRFAAPGPLERELRLDIAIDWPVLLDGRVQLQLIVAGTVVWSSGTETAMRILRHEFKTRSVVINAPPP